jgi:hypothetical protein
MYRRAIVTDEPRYIRGEIRVWQTRADPNVIDIALKFDGLEGDLRTTVEDEARPGGNQLRRHPNLYRKLARALAAEGKYRGPLPTPTDDEN